MRTQLPGDITNQALSVKLIPADNEALTAEKDFDWVTIEYTPNYLKLQLSFDSPTSISSEGLARRDSLEVMVRNPFMFYSDTRREVIPPGTKNWALIPQQLAADQAEAIDETM